jgi:hypothetical protein
MLLEVDAVPNSTGVIGLSQRFPAPTWTAVMVVEHTLDQALAQMPTFQSWRFVWALDAHCKYVFPCAECFGHIEREGLEIAGMMPKELTVEEHIREIIYSIKMKSSKLPVWSGAEFMAEPNNTVMIKPAQEPIGRDGHRFPVRIIKARLVEFGIIFSGITPEAIQVYDDGILLI